MKLLKEMKKPFSVIFYVIHRLWRILPLYVGVILLILSLTTVSSGPIWHDTVDKYFNECFNNWWSNLIFLNNYLHPVNSCMTHSWYIACDMQLYLFSLIILLPLLRRPKVGITLAIICTIISMVASSLIVHLNKLPPTMLYVHPDPEQRINYWGTTYFKPYPHAGPYFVGILVGYLLATKPKIQFSRTMQISGWCVTVVSNMAVLYGVLGWNRGIEPTAWETILYSACHRTAWALGVAWVVICCATGQGGVVHYILTMKAWIPISRLTYAAYLIHPIVQIGMLGSIRIKLQPSHDFAIWMFFGHLMTTYGASFGLSMLIEAPCLELEKLLLQKKESTKNSTSTKTCADDSVSENGHIKKPVLDGEAGGHESITHNQVCRL